MPCQQPPWGELTAVNVNTGEFAWRVPLGVTDSLPADKQKTGRPGNGGTIATAGGLVFVGATDDSRLPGVRCEDGEGVVDVQAGWGGGSDADDLSGEGRTAVCGDYVYWRRIF